MKWQRYTGYFVDAVVLLLVAVVLLAVPLFREEQSSFIGRESYFLARFAQDITGYDSLSYSGRVASYNVGTPYVMSLVPEEYWKYLPFFFAYVSVIIFWLLLRSFGIEKKWGALLILAFSPSFLFLASTPNRFVMPVLLLLLSFLFFNSEKKIITYIGIPVALILPLFDFMFSVIAFVIFLIFAISRKRFNSFWFASIGLFIATVVYFLFLYSKAGLPELFNPENQFFGLNYSLRALISDFGGFAGVSLFSFILFIIGIFSVWTKKYSRPDIFLTVSFLLILTLFRIEAIILLSMAVSVFAFKGVDYLVSSIWENKTLKWLILLIGICGILFSALAYSKELIVSEPTPGFVSAMEFLSSQEDGVVFSDYSRGNWISFAGKKNVLDQNFLFAPQSKERFFDSRTLLFTRDYNEASKLFQKYNIRYIWIDKELKDKLYSGKIDGLLFLAVYSSDIKNIYNQGGVQIWEISGR